MARYKSAREIARAISNGEIPPQHLGYKSYEMLRQELFSLLNEKDKIRTPEERQRFDKRLTETVESANSLSPIDRDKIYAEVDKMLGAE